MKYGIHPAVGYSSQPYSPELAVLVKLYRELRKWSQEQLAEIAGLSTRTVQRVEEGLPASTDTRRALARAFDIEDIDVFNKAYTIPTAEQIAEEKARFENSLRNYAANRPTCL